MWAVKSRGVRKRFEGTSKNEEEGTFRDRDEHGWGSAVGYSGRVDDSL